MNTSTPNQGTVALCDEGGAVVQLLRDDLKLVREDPIGLSLISLVDEAVTEKLDRFLSELRTTHATCDWEITVSVNGTLTPLHFVGARIDQGFVVVIARSRGGLAQFNDELMAINNEQTNTLRYTLKELSLRSPDTPDPDSRFYNDLSQLNNELANLQREMAKKNTELEKLNEQKNAFLGMAAHDLRSPLGVIQIYAEFLETEAADVLNEEQREFVTTIKETSKSMLQLVVDLLDVSTIESGRLRLNRESTDLARLIEHNVALNRPLAARKGITIDFEPPPVGAEWPCDAGKIEQVLNNLIGNAIKFSDRNGVVSVRLATTSPTATVSVVDRGMGIPEADLPKLFTPFEKVSRSGTEDEPGTGLGLLICRRIIEGHGGRLEVESTVGQGSTFSFTLPRNPPHP